MIIINTSIVRFSVRACLLIGLVLQSHSWAKGAEENSLVLPALLDALEKNPRLDARRASVDAKVARLEIVESERLPRLQFSGDGDLLSTNTTQQSLTASLEHTLYDWGSLQAGIDSATANRDAEALRAEATALDLKLAVVENFVAASSASLRQGAMQAGRATAEELRDLMQRRVAQRVNPGSDLLIVDSRIAQLESSQLQFQGAERDAQLSLLQLTGYRAKVDRELNCTATLDEAALAQLATDTSPELASARASSRSIRSEFGAVDAKRLPAIVAGVSITRDLDEGDSDARGFLSFRYNYDLGNTLDTELAELEAEYAAAQFEERRIAQQVVRETAGLVNQYWVNAQQLPLLQSMVKLRTDQLASHTRRFASGKSTWLDLMSAESDLVDARLTEIQARASTCLAVLSLEQITGRNLSE